MGGGAMTLAFGPHFCCDLQVWLLSSEESQALDHPTDIGLNPSRSVQTAALKLSNKPHQQQHASLGYMNTGCIFLPTFLVRKMKVCLEAMGGLDKSRSIVKVGGGCFASSSVIDITLDMIDTTLNSFESQSSLPSSPDVISGYDALRLKKGDDDFVSVMAIPISQTLYESLQGSPLRNKHNSDLIQRCIVIGIRYLLLGKYVHDSTAGSNRAAKPMSGVQRASQFLQTLSVRHRFPWFFTGDVESGAGTSYQHPKPAMKFEIVGNILMLPEYCLVGPDWDRVFAMPYQREVGSGHEEDNDGPPVVDDAAVSTTYGSYVFRSLADCFGLKRVARKATIDSGPKRESRVRLLYPQQGQPDATGPEAAGWVAIVENRIRFGFDITRVMFCSGNVTERMRMGRQRAEGEVVVDLYCGIGYYSIPLLVHGCAAHVHACEWNANSLQALRENLNHAGMLERCMIYEGDNQITSRSLVDVADRVLLGTVVL